VIALRPYQLDAIEAVRAEIRAGRRRVLLCVPTGGGKTLTAASVLASAVRKGSRVLFVAHRKELIDQCCSTFARLGVTSFGVIRAQDPRRDPMQPIQIASIQTLARREKPPADIVVIDEGHRALAKSYIKHLFEAYPTAIFILLTATPCRTDGRPLKDVADALVIGALYSGLISEGFIVAPIVYGTPVLPDLRKVRTTAGDFNQEDLEAAVNRSALIGNCVAEWQKRSEGRKTVVFAVSVAHSRALCDAFSAAGARAGHIDGATPENERAETLARLERGDLDVVCNVGVLCEGWDMPSCKCLVLARPTKSLALYMQMAGRILRPWENVTPLILDHGGNVDRHGMPHEDRPWSLEGKVKRAKGAPAPKPCPVCFCYVATNTRVCACGHVFAPSGGEVDRDRELEVVPVELALRTLEGPDAMLTFFRNTAKTAAERGWKPGAVAVRFRERFGRYPPAGWMPKVKKGLAADAEWTAKRARRDAASETEREALETKAS
jgi:superfamily II DNA or RNA helicase